jgi:hypothetical protein
LSLFTLKEAGCKSWWRGNVYGDFFLHKFGIEEWES